MAEIIKMPRLSDTMEEGNIVAWMKSVGDAVEPGDVLAEVETDKATMELESFHSGVLLHIGIEKGPVPVDGIIAVIGKKGEDFKSQLAEEEANLQSATQKEVVEVAPEPVKTAPKKEVKLSPSTPVKTTAAPSLTLTADNGRILASPLARKLANKSRVSLGNISGTGDGGRIVKKDVELYLKQPRIIQSPSKKNAPKKINIAPPSGVNYGRNEISQMRKTIARRLGESKFSAPHFYLSLEINMTKAVAIRNDLKAVSDEKVSFNDMVIKACGLALRAHPAINSSWMEDHIRINEDINIGVAVAVEDGLLVPVLFNADQMSLNQINTQVRGLAGKAKSKKLQMDEMQGNTFTISNLGMFGIDEFTAIINPPDACIMAVGGIKEKAIVVNGKLEVGSMMNVTLSCDHRVVDGATGSKFLQLVKQLLENPVSLLLN